MLSLVEKPTQIKRICDLYDFNFSGKAQIFEGRYESGDEPDIKKIANKGGINLAKSDLLLIDGISMLYTPEGHRPQILSFINQVKDLELNAILVAEEYKANEDIFLQYAVDGVIRLSLDPHTCSRKIEIPKIRWHNQYLGSHAYKLKAKKHLDQSKRTNSINDLSEKVKLNQTGVLFFPSVNCLVGQKSVQSVYELKKWYPFTG